MKQIKNRLTTQQKTLASFVIAIVILIGSFIIGVNYLKSVEISESVEKKIETVLNEFTFLQSKDVDLMRATIVTIQQNRELQKYWLDRNRGQLLEKSLPLFNEIQEIANVTHFYFHDVSTVNFLRVHYPQKHGDIIDRFTMKDAKRDNSFSSGIEIGPLGIFVLRVVIPWYINGKLEGYIELGTEIEHITKQIRTSANVDLFMFYNKKIISKEKYYPGIEALNKHKNWNIYNNWVLMSNSNEWIPDIFMQYSKDDFSEHSLEDNEFTYLNQDYIVKSIPISDAGERVVAKMLILINSTEQFASIRNISFLISIIAIEVGVILFVLFYLAIYRMGKALDKSQKKISEETIKRENEQKTHIKELEVEKVKLLESESRFQTVVMHSQPRIFVIDKNGIVLLSEGKMLDKFGLRSGEIVGQSIFDVFTDYTEVLSLFNKALNGEVFEGIIELDGLLLETCYTPNLDSNGEILDVLITALDITERKEAEDALKKQSDSLEKTNKELQKSRMAALSIMQDANMQKSRVEEAYSDLERSSLESKKLSLAIEQAPVTVLITDLGGNIEYVNPHFTEVTGYSKEEALGQNPRILQSGNLPTSIYSNMWETLSSNKIWRGELENKKKNGEIYWENVSISPINDKDGNITHYVAVKEDVTKRREHEFELRKAKTVAEAATEAKSRFLASMSHEIRTPMNAIIGLSYLVLKTELSNRQLDYLTKIDSSAKSLLKLINDILDFSKIEAGELVVENIDFNLEEVITSVTNLISQKVFDKGLELIVHTSPNVPLNLIGDPLRLGQILTNFCNNAVKFTEKGEIVVAVTLVTENKKEAELLFSVKDTGVGIKEENKDKLFKAFQQADTSTTREFGGTGLGLVITESLAKLMKGDIWFESKENIGSTFNFSIKLAKQNIENLKQKLLTEELDRMKILLYNNYSTTNQYLLEILESVSFKVETASSHNEFITKFAQSVDDPFKLIITDSKELEKENLESLELVKKNYNAKIIMLISQFMWDKISVTNIVEIVDSFLFKPFNYSDLFNSIMELFGKAGKIDITVLDDKNEYEEDLEKMKGSLVLLAEDNGINQQVATEMLEGIGINVEVAENGLKAVEMVENSGTPSKYSLILMDIQMPIMDGYTATNKIKKLKNYENLPIIAMTADAMSDVKEKCFDIGMVDYLTKPIEPDKVLKTLLKWIEPNKRVPDYKLETKQNIKKTNDATKIEIEHIAGINVKDALKYVGNDKELYISLLQKFLDNVNFENQINKAVEKNNIKEAIRLIHTLKGNAGLLGMNELKNVTDKAQNALLKDDSLDVIEYVEEIMDELMPLLNSLKLFFTNEKGEENKDVKFIEEVEEKLFELEVLLKSHDLEAVNLVEDISTIIGFKNETIKLKRAIKNYQFEEALEILQKIKS